MNGRPETIEPLSKNEIKLAWIPILERLFFGFFGLGLGRSQVAIQFQALFYNCFRLPIWAALIIEVLFIVLLLFERALLLLLDRVLLLPGYYYLRRCYY